jgi:TPR repeat protein
VQTARAAPTQALRWPAEAQDRAAAPPPSPPTLGFAREPARAAAAAPPPAPAPALASVAAAAAPPPAAPAPAAPPSAPAAAPAPPAQPVVALAAPSPPPARPAARPIPAMEPEEVQLLLRQGEQFMAAGDVATARIVLRRAAEAGVAAAALALGETYDPAVLSKLGTRGMVAEPTTARQWYEKARQLGSNEAARRIELLAGR